MVGDATIVALVRTAFAVVTARILTILGLWMVFGLACWAMYSPTMERIYIAGGFAILVYIPSVAKESRGTVKERRNEGQEQPE